MSGGVPVIGAVQAVRGAYGVLQLARPGLVAESIGAGPIDRRARSVARVLGARQVVQTLSSGRWPSYPVLALGVEVDLAHSVSMLAVAFVDRRRRRAALTSAAVAGTFAAAGALAARHAKRRTDRRLLNGPERLRERWAHRLAAALVPGFPPRVSNVTRAAGGQDSAPRAGSDGRARTSTPNQEGRAR